VYVVKTSEDFHNKFFITDRHGVSAVMNVIGIAANTNFVSV
jgi:hypothetical protein